MTIKQCEKEKGMEIACVTNLYVYRWGEIEVNFFDPNENREDSTSFDVHMPLGLDGLCELIGLYEDFCKENNIPSNTVESLVLTHVAETYDDLTQIC